MDKKTIELYYGIPVTSGEDEDVTFEDYINGDYNFVWPDIVSNDTVVQNVISDWFGLRIVPDTEKFQRFFNRKLEECYPYYQQLLRIDPTISNFDWLVENYLERQTVGTEAGSSSENSNSSGDSTGKSSISRNSSGTAEILRYGTTTVTESGSEQDAISGSEVLTNDLQAQTKYAGDEKMSYSGGETLTYGGSETTSQAGTETHVASSSSTQSLSENYASSKNDVPTGTERTSDYGTITTRLETSRTSTNDTDTVTSENRRAVSQGRQGPMSASYTDASGDFGGSNGTGNATGLYAGLKSPAILNPSQTTDEGDARDSKQTVGVSGSNSGTDTTTETRNGVYQERSFDMRKDSSLEFGQSASSTQGSKTSQDTLSFDGRQSVRSFNNRTDSKTFTSRSDTKTFENRVDTKSDTGTSTKSYNDRVNTHTFNNRQTTTVSGTSGTPLTENTSSSSTDSSTTNNEASTSGTSSKLGSTSMDRKIQEISTGRGKDIPALLTAASLYVKRSISWEWLKGQLDPLFLQTY